MEAARTAGYRIVLHYVSVDPPDQALIRIRNRVVPGGHDVAESGGSPVAPGYASSPTKRRRAVSPVMLSMSRSPMTPRWCTRKVSRVWR